MSSRLDGRLTPLELRADIPALDSTAYFNTGASGPSPRYVVEAAESYTEGHEYDAHASGDPYSMAFDTYDEVREAVASFLGAHPDEIALTESTTDGINRFAGALDWTPGDVVVRTDLEHPAGVLPWERLERDGVEVRVVESEGGRLDRAAFEAAVEDAKLVCLSAVSWTRGTKLPVAELTDIAHRHDALVLVDAVQAPGQMPVDVREWGADAVAAAGHKWLLGLWGAGFLYVRSDLAERLEPTAIGYRSVTDSGATPFEYEAGARRFEIGTTNPAAHVALQEAIGVFEDIGLSTVSSRIERLTDHLKANIPEDRLLGPRSYESGLVPIAVDDAEATVERLADRSIVVRALPGEEAIRVSVHAFNTADEIDRLVETLDF